MKILVGTLIIAVAIFPNVVELKSPTGSPERPLRSSPEHRFYENYRVQLPHFLASAPIVASRYPRNPAPEFATMLRHIDFDYVPLDANTIIISRGPIIFGWQDEHMIHPLYVNHSPGYAKAIYDEELEEISVIINYTFMDAICPWGPAPPVTVHTPEIGSRRGHNHGINVLSAPIHRFYEHYNTELPHFLHSAQIVALRYPQNPAPKVRKLLRFINNKYVPCDKDTIIIQRGPAIFGWKNENGHINGLNIFERGIGHSKAIYDVELRELRRVSNGFQTAMGMGKIAPPLSR